MSRCIADQIEARPAYFPTATLAGLSFPVMSFLDVIAAGLAIPVALLSIAVLFVRLRNEMRKRPPSDRSVAGEKRPE